ncbi:hypothetical protein WN55_03239 [Dufourea novaeangliae]|uniref:Uncharacterized protein n=1 Tax=Dufourea novaeangliae TaxID=178035 RepID=A0A154PLK0_DUFNO|nr:hypothetical protein WN55_03239 [Dufourea novaeangliae]
MIVTGPPCEGISCVNWCTYIAKTDIEEVSLSTDERPDRNDRYSRSVYPNGGQSHDTYTYRNNI